MPAANYGRNVFQASSGIPTRLTADGNPLWHVGGITVDWTKVTPLASPVTIASDQLTVPVGAQFLQVGQVMAKIISTGLFAPYDPAAVTGATMSIARGDVVLIDRTVILNGILGFTVQNNTIIGAIEGGVVYFDLIIQAGTGTASVAAGPTLATLETAMPRLSYAKL